MGARRFCCAGIEWCIVLYILGFWWLGFTHMIRHRTIRYLSEAWNV